MSEYKERDTIALDEAGDFFAKHMNAMTKEGLHGKFEIAAELAWRDKCITELEAENLCDACLGQPPISTAKCMCNGTGKMSIAALELRRLLLTERERAEQAEDENKRLKGEIRKALTHTVEMGGSFNQWHSEISAILRQALQGDAKK